MKKEFIFTHNILLKNSLDENNITCRQKNERNKGYPYF